MGYNKRQMIVESAIQAQEKVEVLGEYLGQVRSDPAISTQPAFRQQVFQVLQKSCGDFVNVCHPAKGGSPAGVTTVPGVVVMPTRDMSIAGTEGVAVTGMDREDAPIVDLGSAATGQQVQLGAGVYFTPRYVDIDCPHCTNPIRLKLT